MLKHIKQARAALSMLNPDEVRIRAERPVHIGLVAATASDYGELEELLAPGESLRAAKPFLHRADEPNPPSTVELVIYHDSVPRTKGTYRYHRVEPLGTIQQILHDHHDEMGLALARQFAGFRQCVVERIIQAVARENAFFAVATALPNIVPNLMELPWAFGEWASDTAFLTANQVRMAFLIAAACGGEVGLSHQKAQVLSIAAGAFGWRAIARELAGKIPLGGGLIPKGAIAYAGTYAVGKGLEYLHHATEYTPAERQNVYRKAFERGKQIVESAGRR